jgi:deoxyadenosine/deoxycytidine kinase
MRSGSPLFIAIEGCIGAGKTTLATKLAAHRRSSLVLEQFEKNPFLPDFYQDPVGNVFETEMQFLLIHYNQLKGLADSPKESITDFTFAKDLIYGEMNFQDLSEKNIFVQLYEFLAAKLRLPDLIIYLKASDDLIIDRIRKRNRSMEQTINVDYFKKLKNAYDDLFLRSANNVHVIDANHFDCLNDSKSLEKICSVIDFARYPVAH